MQISYTEFRPNQILNLARTNIRVNSFTPLFEFWLSLADFHETLINSVNYWNLCSDLFYQFDENLNKNHLRRYVKYCFR